MSATPRLFVDADLAEGVDAALGPDQSHYLVRVMRLATGSPVRVFNGRDGEFDAVLAEGGKSSARLRIGARTRTQAVTPDLWLLFSPLKKTRTDFVVEKAVELGAAELHPVLTDRCDADTVRVERLQRIAIEAAEQTERLDIPPVREAVGLYALLDRWDASRTLFFCDEAGQDGEKPWGGDKGRALALADALSAGQDSPAAILIGPEGGFSPAERARLRSLPFVQAVGLGPRILRAETAAIAALSIWQALAGDWRNA